MPTIRTPTAKGGALNTSEAEAIIKLPIAAQAISYNVTAAHNREIHELANGITATLPTVSGSLTETDDWEVTFKAVGASATVARNSQNIDGVASDITLLLNDSVTVAMNAAQTGFYIKHRSYGAGDANDFLGTDGTDPAWRTINDVTTITGAVDQANDYAMIYDASATANRKVLLSNLRTSTYYLVGGSMASASYNPATGTNTRYSAFTDGDPAPTDAYKSICPASGTLSNFRVRCSNNPITDDIVFTLMINGSASSLAVTVTTGAPTALVSDTVNSEAVSAGDQLSVRAVCAGGSGSVSHVAWTLDLA